MYVWRDKTKSKRLNLLNDICVFGLSVCLSIEFYVLHNLFPHVKCVLLPQKRENERKKGRFQIYTLLDQINVNALFTNGFPFFPHDFSFLPTTWLVCVRMRNLCIFMLVHWTQLIFEHMIKSTLYPSHSVWYYIFSLFVFVVVVVFIIISSVLIHWAFIWSFLPDCMSLPFIHYTFVSSVRIPHEFSQNH